MVAWVLVYQALLVGLGQGAAAVHLLGARDFFGSVICNPLTDPAQPDHSTKPHACCFAGSLTPGAAAPPPQLAALPGPALAGIRIETTALFIPPPAEPRRAHRARAPPLQS
ncbi:hypothetical protein ACRC7T_05325 [Segnochrobactraceae bacterium EtOH-i3]